MLRDFRQGLAHKRQAEGGGDDAVMQSAVSVCEGALGILKAALAGALTSNQLVRSSSCHMKGLIVLSSAQSSSQGIQVPWLERRLRTQKVWILNVHSICSPMQLGVCLWSQIHLAVAEQQTMFLLRVKHSFKWEESSLTGWTRPSEAGSALLMNSRYELFLAVMPNDHYSFGV